MRGRLAAISALMLFVTPAFAQTQNTQSTQMGSQPLTQQDRNFLLFAARTNVSELGKSLLGQTRAENQAVRAYARLLTDDHTQNASRLAAIINVENLQPPVEIGMSARQAIEQLANVPPQAFDMHFIQDEIRGNSRTANVFEAAARESNNPLVRDYAEETLAVQQQHTALARTIDSGLGGNRMAMR